MRHHKGVSLATGVGSEEAVVIPGWLDLSAVVVGAFAGVLAGKKYSLDLVGFIAMCLICALGGGLLRDAIMQTGSVYALESPLAIPLCVLTALIGFLFPSTIQRFPNLYEWVDMMSVALYVVAGTDKAITAGLHMSAIVLMGVITGVGGGMLRDVFMGEVPHVFRPSNFYALCAVAGSLAYFVCISVINADQTVSTVISIAVVLLLRRLSLRLDLVTPANVDLEPTVVSTGKRAVRKVRNVARNDDSEE